MAKLKPIRVVIVDDHEVVRIGLIAVLDLIPEINVVGHASRNAEAEELVLHLKPDLVLLDICLPDGSGVDVARDILASCPNTRVLFLTSFADDHTVLEAALSGAQGFILKDISSDELVRAIQTVASGQDLIDPRVKKDIVHWMKNVSTRPGKAKRELLSSQEERLLPLVSQGLTNKEIAQCLELSEKTVKNYIANIGLKLRIRRRAQIASFYARSFKCAGSTEVTPDPPLNRAAESEDYLPLPDV
jgi:DNA-binding NarL/FixJ family response regulator